MTTETELQALLRADADSPLGAPAPWADVVRRGHHHRRLARVRVVGALTAVAVLVGAAVAALQDDPSATVVVDQPDRTTTTTTPPTTAVFGPGVSYPIGADARVSGAFVTISIEAADPSTGFDPCRQRLPIVAEAPDRVTVAVRDRYASPTSSVWAACHASAFSGWATVELTDPLAGRPLLDENGREIPVIDNTDLLFPTFVPTPFVHDEWDELGGETGLVDRTFSWSADDLVLSVRNAPLEGSVPLGGNPGDGCADGESTTVRGHPALLCRAERGGFVVLWDEGGWRRQIELGPVSDNSSPFTLDDVMAIAASLEPLG